MNKNLKFDVLVDLVGSSDGLVEPNEGLTVVILEREREREKERWWSIQCGERQDISQLT